MKKIFNYSAFILLVLFTSCVEREIDYDFDFGESVIVVSGILTQEGVCVYVQRTVNPMSPASDSFIDAQVSLFENTNQIIELFQTDSGNYLSPEDFIPQYDIQYYLIIVTNEGDTLISNTQELTRPVKIDTCYYKPRTSNKGKELCFMEFTDPVDENNFYLTYRYDEYANGELLPSRGAYWNIIGTPVSDELFNGQEKTIVHEFSIRGSSNLVRYDKDSLRLKLFSYSEDFAAYLIELNDSKLTYDDFLFDQPIFPKSFIQNGYGVFGSYAVEHYVLKLD